MSQASRIEVDWKWSVVRRHVKGKTGMVERHRPRYRAYLLRCWESGANDGVPDHDWRFSLEDPHTGQRRNYAGIEALITALRSDLMEHSLKDCDRE